jgi:hypothetical protein
MNCRQILNELDQDVFSLTRPPQKHGQQRSMHAVLQQSWSLLDPTEHEALKRLSVFREGFSHESASSVAQVSSETLATLVDHSMLRFDQTSGRYQMRRLHRQFAGRETAAKEAAP